MLRWLRRKKADPQHSEVVKTEDFQIMDTDPVTEQAPTSVNISHSQSSHPLISSASLVPLPVTREIHIQSQSEAIAESVQSLATNISNSVERISDDTSFRVQFNAEEISKKTEVESLRIRALLECCMPWTRPHTRLE